MESACSPLVFEIINGPPELDWVFSLVRESHPVNLQLALEGVQQEMRVYIISLETGSNSKSIWSAKGHFWGDGEKTFSTFSKKDGGYHTLNGVVEITYNSRRRKGTLTLTSTPAT